MYCNHCKQYNDEGVSFCYYCGAPMNANQNYQNAPASEYGYVPVSPAPKKKSKKLWIIIPSVVLTLALVGVIAVWLLVANSPQMQVVDGVTNSLAELEDSMKSAKTFYSIYEKTSSYINEKEFSFDLQVNEHDYGSDVRLGIDYSANKKVISANADFDIDGVSLEMILAANEDHLMLQFEQLDDTFYSLPLKNFGREYKNSSVSELLNDLIDDDDFSDVEDVLEKLSIDLFASTDFEAFRDRYEDFDNWVTNLPIEEIEQDIPHTSGLTVYRATINCEELVAIYEKYYRFQLEELLGKEAADQIDLDEMFDDMYDEMEDKVIIAYFGINDDDCLSAIYGYYQDDAEESFSIVLSGRKNLWDEVTIYERNEEVGGLCICETSRGFTVEFFDTYYDEREVAATVECDDAAQQIVITTEDDETFVIDYALDGKESRFSFDVEDDVSFDLTFSPFRGVTLPAGEEKELLTFDEEDFDQMGEDIVDAFD